MSNPLFEMSFDATQVADLTEVIAELPHADDNPRKHPVKKLLNNFDDLAKGDTNQPVNEENMKVMLVLSNKSKEIPSKS